MKIALITEWYSENMGYAENFLPKALGKLGHDVHLISSDLQIYGNNIELYDSMYKDFLGDRIVCTGTFQKENFTLHRNKHSNKNGLHVDNLKNKLIELKPDIVYLFEILTTDFLNVVSLQDELKFKVFTESRLHSSILYWPKNLEDLKYYIKMFKLGRKTSKYVSKYYPIAKDVAFNINFIYGIPKSKIKLSSLGVDIETFSSLRFLDNEKNEFRNSLKIKETDFICVYTGRLNEDKEPLLLAKAVNYLFGLGYTDIKALFVGKGSSVYLTQLLSNRNCIVKDFVVNKDLPLIYSSSNVGVWPKQESTSRLDAMSCGLPIIIPNTLSNKNLIQDCGYVFKANNYIDLADKILSLYNNRNDYSIKSINSRKKIELYYSWQSIAESRIKDFSTFD
jgi:glycosyltransferase involved in cell wall biosynthesis